MQNYATNFITRLSCLFRVAQAFAKWVLLTRAVPRQDVEVLPPTSAHSFVSKRNQGDLRTTPKRTNQDTCLQRAGGGIIKSYNAVELCTYHICQPWYVTPHNSRHCGTAHITVSKMGGSGSLDTYAVLLVNVAVDALLVDEVRVTVRVDWLREENVLAH